MSTKCYAIVAGGGTAGHLQPALAIANALVTQGHDRTSIEFVGSRRGQDRITLEGRGHPVHLLPGRGIARSMKPSMVVRNIRSVAALVAALGMAVGIVLRRRPRVVVSVGGYASAPAAAAAVLLGVPLVLVNVDAVPGAANRLFGRFARANAVGWEGTPLPRSVVTGTPVRPEIVAVHRSMDDRRSARTSLGLAPDRATVVIFGGSLGARSINNAAEGLMEIWSTRIDRSIYHIVGHRDWEDRLADKGAADRALQVIRVPYEERMALLYTAADVVVCRAGAMTVAELSVAGVPAVLVPLPGAPGDHQTANARVLERAGAARVLVDSSCNGPNLASVLDVLLGDPAGLDAMGRAGIGVGHPDAAMQGARVVEANAAAPRRKSAGARLYA